jgi:hypothetical protein
MSDLDSFLIPQNYFNILLKLKSIPISLLPDIESPLSDPATFEVVQEKVRKSGLSSVGFSKSYIFDKVYSILVDLDKKEDEYLSLVETALKEVVNGQVYHYSRKRKEIFSIEPYDYNLFQHEPTISSLPTKIWNKFGGKSFTISQTISVKSNNVRRGWLTLAHDMESVIESEIIESIVDAVRDINETRQDIFKIAEALPTLLSIPPEKTNLLTYKQVLIQHDDKSFYLVYGKGFDLLLNFEPEVKCKI